MRQHQYRDVSNLNAPYDNLSLQGLGGYGSLGFNMEEEEHNIPWMKPSPVTLSIQKDLNPKLRTDGYNILLEDGILGPRTCGALQHYGRTGEVWGACDAHAAEFIAPTKASGLMPAPVVEETKSLARKGGSVPSWVWALLVGGGAIGVAIFLKKKKRLGR
jgi:hypothetical protein